MDTITLRGFGALALTMLLATPALAQIPGDPGTRWGEPPAPARAPGERPPAGDDEAWPADEHTLPDEVEEYDDLHWDAQELEEEDGWPAGADGLEGSAGSVDESGQPLEDTGSAPRTWDQDAQGDDPDAELDVREIEPYEEDLVPVENPADEPPEHQEPDVKPEYRDPREPPPVHEQGDGPGHGDESREPEAGEGGGAVHVPRNPDADVAPDGDSPDGEEVEREDSRHDPRRPPEDPETGGERTPEAELDRTEGAGQGDPLPAEHRRYDIFDYDESEAERMWEQDDAWHDDEAGGGREFPRPSGR